VGLLSTSRSTDSLDKVGVPIAKAIPDTLL
jgi:hypothetical protein